MIQGITNASAAAYANQTNQARDARPSQDARPVADPDAFATAAASYDPRHMTMGELAAMSQGLYDSGAISLKDHALLSFDWERALKDLGEQVQGVENAGIDGVPTNPDGEYDMISVWEQRLDYRREQGMPTQDTERILGLLRQVEARRVLGQGLVV